MRGKAGLLIGLGAGYVLGARAGRGRYEEIKDQAQRLRHDPRVEKAEAAVTDAAGQAAAVAAEKTDQAAEAVGEKNRSLQDTVSDKAAQAKDAVSGAADQVAAKADDAAADTEGQHRA